MTSLLAVDLRTEHLVEPLSIARSAPRSMWRCTSTARGARQTAFRQTARAVFVQLAGVYEDLTVLTQNQLDVVCGHPILPKIRRGIGVRQSRLTPTTDWSNR